MLFVISFAAVSLLLSLNAAFVYALQRRQASDKWWSAIWIAWLIGLGLGVWAGFFFEYQPSDTLRVFGAPLPTVIFHWEGRPGEEQWIDFITPAQGLFAICDVLILALLCGCTIGFAYLGKTLIEKRANKKGNSN